MTDKPREPQPEAEEREDTGATRGARGDRAEREVGGPTGLEPTRYGDWERNGRCYDF